MDRQPLRRKIIAGPIKLLDSSVRGDFQNLPASPICQVYVAISIHQQVEDDSAIIGMEGSFRDPGNRRYFFLQTCLGK